METPQTPSTSLPSSTAGHTLQAELPHSLQRCAKCKTTFDCSDECQKDDGKDHTPVCSSQAVSHQHSTPGDCPQQPVERPNPSFSAAYIFLGLANDDHLHELSENEAFTRLIDCFRLRMEDEYKFGCNSIGVSVQEDPVPAFKSFLDLAESRAGLLPPWWNAEKRRECERIAVDSTQWSDINCTVEKGDIQERYENVMTLLMLRLLGEKVYGRGFV